MTIRTNIDSIVSEVTDCVMGGIAVDGGDSETQMVGFLKEIVSEHGPFNIEEISYIFNHVGGCPESFDWMSNAFDVNYRVLVTVTKR